MPTLRKVVRALAVTVGLCVVLGHSGELVAQSIDYGALEQLFNEPITTSATGSPQRVSEVPVNMEIVTAEDIRRSGADNIPDILRFIAGVDVRRYGFADADVSVRGYDQQYSSRLLVLVNGRQVYVDFYGYTAWQAIPVQLDEIRQIEIIKGPNSALFGFNAIGGVINIITYDPLRDAVQSVTARAGTKDYVSGSGVATVNIADEVGVRFSGGGYRADEFSTRTLPPAFGPYDDSAHQYSMSADGRAKLSTHVEATLEATVSNAGNLDASPVPAYINSTHETYSVKGGLTADTAVGLLNASAYHNEDHYAETAAIAAYDIANALDVAQVSDLLKIRSNHTLRLGLEFRNSRMTSSVVGRRVGYNVYAANAMWNWQLSPRATFTNSVRVDRLGLSYDAALLPGNPYTLSQYNSANLTAVSFNSSVVLNLTEDDVVRLMAARGIQAPSLIDFGFQNRVALGPYSVSYIGSPLLRPAAAMNYEIGYNRRIPALHASLDTDVFYQRTDHLLASAANAPLQPGPAGFEAFSQNVGSSDAAGAEVSLKGTAGQALRWKASYSFISIQDHLNVGPLSQGAYLLDYEHGSPHSMINLVLGRDRGPFSVDLQAHWQSGFTDYSVSGDGSIQPEHIASGLTTNLRLAYAVTKVFSVALTGENLTRQRTFTSAGVPVERRGFLSVTAKMP